MQYFCQGGGVYQVPLVPFVPLPTQWLLRADVKATLLTGLIQRCQQNRNSLLSMYPSCKKVFSYIIIIIILIIICFNDSNADLPHLNRRHRTCPAGASHWCCRLFLDHCGTELGKVKRSRKASTDRRWWNKIKRKKTSHWRTWACEEYKRALDEASKWGINDSGAIWTGRNTPLSAEVCECTCTSSVKALKGGGWRGRWVGAREITRALFD